MSLHCIMRTQFAVNYTYPSPQDTCCCIHKVKKKHRFQMESGSQKCKSRLQTIPAMEILTVLHSSDQWMLVFSVAAIPIYPGSANILIQTGCLALLPLCAGMLVERSDLPLLPWALSMSPCFSQKSGCYLLPGVLDGADHNSITQSTLRSLARIALPLCLSQ